MSAGKNQYLRQYVDSCRQEIQPHIIIRRLVGHVSGDVDMSPSQVSAGLGLLRKVLPDVTSMDISMMHEAGPETLNRIERVIVDTIAQQDEEKRVIDVTPEAEQIKDWLV